MRSLTDGEFGVALACHIQHDDVIERIAKQMLRLTKPSGYIVVMDWIVGNAYFGANRPPVSV